MSKWIKKDDQVVVIAGNHKGMTGKVLVRKGDRVIVEKINVRKRHLKSKQKQGASQIIEIEKPIHISNISLSNAVGQPVKLKSRQTSNGGKELFYIDGEKEVVHRQIRKGA